MDVSMAIAKELLIPHDSTNHMFLGKNPWIATKFFESADNVKKLETHLEQLHSHKWKKVEIKNDKVPAETFIVF